MVSDPSGQAIRVMHSSTFKNKPGAESEYFTAAKPGGSTVVVLGAGETGHDIAYTAVTSPHVRRVVLASRDGFFVAPKIIPAPVILRIWGVPTPGTRPNKPIDTAIASLFDTAYVPPLLQHSQLQWKVYEYTIKAIFAWICGTSWGLDQWAGEVSSGRRHLDSCRYCIFLRQDACWVLTNVADSVLCQDAARHPLHLGALPRRHPRFRARHGRRPRLLHQHPAD